MVATTRVGRLHTRIVRNRMHHAIGHVVRPIRADHKMISLEEQVIACRENVRSIRNDRWFDPTEDRDWLRGAIVELNAATAELEGYRSTLLAERN